MLNNINTMLTDALGPAGPLLALGFLGVVLILIALPSMLKKETDGFSKLKAQAAQRLCCTNPVRDSFRESSVVAGLHEQTHTPHLQDQELAGL